MTGTALKSETPNANTGNKFPWAGQPDETACNFAFGHLVQQLPARVALDGKVHAPTLVAAAGAVAGVCAQVSLLSDVAKITKAREEKKILEIKLKADNRMFLYGDALNEMLYSVRDPVLARSRVWNMMVSAAISKGLDRNDLPNVPDMFRRISESYGTEMEGRPSVAAEFQPVAAVRDLLILVGPVAFAALSGEINPTVTADTGRANRMSWVSVSAQAAANMLLFAARSLPPKVALTIAMESAIYASKMRANAPPETAPQPEAAPQA